MGKIGIIILLVLCLTLLLLKGCVVNTVKPEPAGSSTGPVEEPVIEDTEEPAEEPGTVYPQQWATGDGTVSNPWANGCIASAYAACPAGGVIYLRAGYYQLAGQLGIWNDSGKAVSFIGEGINKTIIRTADAVGFAVEHSNVTFKGFTLDGDAQTGSKYGFSLGCFSYDVGYLEFEDIEVKNCSLSGMNVLQCNYSSFKNIYAHDNTEHGIHPGGYTAGRNKYNTYQDIYCWDNVSCGFGDIGIEGAAEETYNTYNNIQAWNNGLHGITLGSSIGVVLSNCIASGNGARGISLYHLEDCTISNCFVTLNGTEGIKIENSKNVNFTNVIAKNNYTGIAITKCSDITLTSCQSYDDRETPLQRYGIQLIETNIGTSLSNCKLSPNAIGEIYNPAGVVIKVITEK